MALKRHGFWNFLRFRLWGRQVARLYRIGKPHPLVAAVTERFVGRLAAAAQRDHTAAGQTEWLARGVENLEFALDANGAVGIYGDLGWHNTGW